MSVSIVTRATARALTTIEHVQGDLGLTPGAPGDEQLSRWIDQASTRAATFCRRTFGRETVRERLCGWRDRINDRGGVLLDREPIVSVASVTIDGTVLNPALYESDVRFLYRLDDASTRRCWLGSTIVVDYVAGWALPGEADYAEPPAGVVPLPADVERAAIQLVAASLSAASRDQMIKSETVEGTGRTDYFVQGAASVLPHPEAEATLAQYRRLLFA